MFIRIVEEDFLWLSQVARYTWALWFSSTFSVFTKMPSSNIRYRKREKFFYGYNITKWCFSSPLGKKWYKEIWIILCELSYFYSLFFLVYPNILFCAYDVRIFLRSIEAILEVRIKEVFLNSYDQSQPLFNHSWTVCKDLWLSIMTKYLLHLSLSPFKLNFQYISSQPSHFYCLKRWRHFSGVSYDNNFPSLL